MTEKPKPDLGAAQAEIQRLIASPPIRRDRTQGPWEDTGSLSLGSKAAIDQFRRKLATERGMSFEQWLEMEASVSHPRDIVPVLPSHRVIARRRMAGAGVPELFLRAVADKEPEDCEPLRQVQDFLSSADGFRVLSGGKGTMKTGSACWALGQLDGGMYVEAMDVIRLSIEDKPKWEAIVAAPLVVFDDLGWEKRDDKAAFTSAFSRLLNTVYTQRRRMIITCNMTRENFKATYGEREFDRMREVGKWSAIAGESVRSYQRSMGQ